MTSPEKLTIPHRALVAAITALIGRVEKRAASSVWLRESDRFAGVIVLLRLASWYLTAPELPALGSIALGHWVDALEDVQVYADLHSTKPYAGDRQMTVNPPVGVYASVAVSYHRDLDL